MLRMAWENTIALGPLGFNISHSSCSMRLVEITRTLFKSRIQILSSVTTLSVNTAVHWQLISLVWRWRYTNCRITLTYLDNQSLHDSLHKPSAVTMLATHYHGGGVLYSTLVLSPRCLALILMTFNTSSHALQYWFIAPGRPTLPPASGCYCWVHTVCSHVRASVCVHAFVHAHGACQLLVRENKCLLGMIVFVWEYMFSSAFTVLPIVWERTGWDKKMCLYLNDQFSHLDRKCFISEWCSCTSGICIIYNCTQNWSNM